jgi:quinolinate synthase
MCAFAKSSGAAEMVVGTETGILHRLEAENPGKKFWPVDDSLVCPNMKKTTLWNLRECLENMSPRVEVDPRIASRARRSIEAMLAVG